MNAQRARGVHLHRSMHHDITLDAFEWDDVDADIHTCDALVAHEDSCGFEDADEVTVQMDATDLLRLIRHAS